MTFPLNNECTNHSLAYNINLRILDLPKDERPEPAIFFKALGNFVEVTHCQLGSFRELHQSAKNLRLQGQDEKFVNGLLGDLLKKMEWVRCQWLNNQSGPLPHNLVQSLEAANPKPKLSDVTEVLKDVFQVTALDPGHLNNWTREFYALYPAEARSSEESMAYNDFQYILRASGYKILEKANAFFSLFEEQSQLNELQSKIELQASTSSEHIVVELFKAFGISHSNAKTQSTYLQRTLSALWVEGHIGCAISRFVSELRARFLSDETDPILNVLNVYRNQVGELNLLFNLDTQLFGGQLATKFLSIQDQAAKVELRVDNQPFESDEHRNQIFEKCILQLKKLRVQSIAVGQSGETLEEHHREEFQKLVNQFLDFKIYKLRATLLTTNAIVLFSKLHNLFNSNMDTTSLLATPFLKWARIALIAKWGGILMASDVSMNFDDLLVILFRAQLLYSQVIATQRTLNGSIFNKLQHFVNQPSKKSAKISSRYLKNLVDESLPLAARWPFDNELPVEPEKVEFSSLTTHLNLKSWQSPISYAARVSRWFTASIPLPKTAFPEYHRQEVQKQETSVHLHRMSTLVDYFYKRGVQDSQKHQDGSTRTRYLLPGEMNIDGVRHQGIIAWVFDADKVCFHRFFHVKLPDELMKNTVRRVFMETSLFQVPSEQLNPAGPSHVTKLTMDDLENCTAVIDELMNFATIKDSALPELGLTVQFLT